MTLHHFQSLAPPTAGCQTRISNAPTRLVLPQKCKNTWLRVPQLGPKDTGDILIWRQSLSLPLSRSCP
jgi:hypothetical protein